jgi:ubiquinone/menaquinone biosynthesis C-methylase UbiE
VTSRSSQADAVQEAFTRQADAFENPASNQPFTTEARWLLDGLPVTEDSIVLDVAAGTGHVARQLAPQVRAVIALDATTAMLERGREAAVAEGLALGGGAASGFGPELRNGELWFSQTFAAVIATRHT